MPLKAVLHGKIYGKIYTQNQALSDDKNLLAWLDFWSKGNHDDRTIVVIVEKMMNNIISLTASDGSAIDVY
jgi:hypothetical protein